MVFLEGLQTMQVYSRGSLDGLVVAFLFDLSACCVYAVHAGNMCCERCARQQCMYVTLWLSCWK